MSFNTNLVGWNCPSKYNDLDDLPCVGANGPGIRGVSGAVNWRNEQDLALQAMSDNRDVAAIEHWRDNGDWEQVAEDGGSDNEEAAEYAEDVVESFNDLIAEIKSEGVQPAAITAGRCKVDVGVLFADWGDLDSPVWYLAPEGKMESTDEKVWDVLAWERKAREYCAIPVSDESKIELEINCDELEFALGADDDDKLLIIGACSTEDEDKIIVYCDSVYREINGKETCTWRAKSDLK